VGAAQYGFRAIIAPSFADIFTANCYRNGVLPVRLPAAEVDILMRNAARGNYELVVDLAELRVADDRDSPLLSLPTPMAASCCCAVSTKSGAPCSKAEHRGVRAEPFMKTYAIAVLPGDGSGRK